MSTRTPTFTGTFRLTRLALRRDRLMIPLWTLGITLLVAATASSFTELYPTTASRVPFARSIESNPGILALTGRGFDLTTIGGLVSWRISGSGALLAAIMSLLLVVRHTRAEEESNRLELLGSTVVGRAAPVAAALLTALAANALVMVLVTVSLIGFDLPAAGALALGLSYLTCGMVFAGLSAISAQLTESARAANGITSSLLGGCYLIRAAGDSTDAHWLSWLSPVGWAQQTRAYAGERWWVPLMAIAVAAGLAAVGYRLALSRDLGAGVLPSRPGPTRAAAWLGSPLALAWRLQRGALLGWGLGFAVLGVVYGGLADSSTDLAESSSELQDVIQSIGGKQGIADAFMSTMLVFGAFVAAAYAVQGVLRLHGEEVDQRAEPLLATPVSRLGWALSHLLVTLVGVTVLMSVQGVAAGLVRGLVAGDVADEVLRTWGAALVQVFAIAVFAGVVTALFGLAPRWAPAGWGFLAAGLLIFFLGSVVTLNHWLSDLSPFTHLPKLPGGEFDWTPLIGLTLVTLVLCAVGLLGLRRRDIG
jgi:ABC-2 type transport system permease protein